MRTLPVPTVQSKTDVVIPRPPTAYQVWYFQVHGVLSRINGQITFVSDDGVVSEHTQEDMRYVVVDRVASEYETQANFNTVYWWWWGGEWAPVDVAA